MNPVGQAPYSGAYTGLSAGGGSGVTTMAGGGAAAFPPGLMETQQAVQKAQAIFNEAAPMGGVQSAGGAQPTGAVQAQSAAGAPGGGEEPGFFSKLGSAIKGFVKGATVNLVKSVVDVVTDPKKLLLAAGAVIVGVAFPPAGMAMLAWGVGNAAINVGKGAMVAAEGWSSGNTELIEKGAADVGTGAAVGGLSVAGLRGSVASVTGQAAKGTGLRQSSQYIISEGRNAVGNFRSAAAEQGVVGAARSAGSSGIQTIRTSTQQNIVQPFRDAFPARSGAAGAADDAAAAGGSSTTGAVAQSADDAGQLALLDDVAQGSTGSTSAVVQGADDAAAAASTTTSAGSGSLTSRVTEGAQNVWTNVRNRVQGQPGEQLALFSERSVAPGLTSRLPGTAQLREGATNVFSGIGNSARSIQAQSPGLLHGMPGFVGPHSEIDELIAQQEQLQSQHTTVGGHA